MGIIMKNKFQKMTRQEKKELIKSFRAESEKNSRYMRTLNEMLVIGILGTIYGIGNLLLDYFVLHVKVYAYVLDGIVLLFGLVLIINRTKFKNAVLNHYAITGKSSVPATAETKKEEVKEEPKKRKHVSKNAQAKKDAKKEEKKVEAPKKEVKKTTTKKATTRKTTTKKTTTKKTTKKTK